MQKYVIISYPFNLFSIFRNDYKSWLTGRTFDYFCASIKNKYYFHEKI